VHQLEADLSLKVTVTAAELPHRAGPVGTAEVAALSVTMTLAHQRQAGLGTVVGEVEGMEVAVPLAEVGTKTVTPNDLAIKRCHRRRIISSCERNDFCILGDLMSPPKGQVCTVLHFRKKIQQTMECAYVITTREKESLAIPAHYGIREGS